MSAGWERGLLIVKHTLCRVGSHVWINNTSGTSTLPRPSDFCNCGLTTWEAAQAPPIRVGPGEALAAAERALIEAATTYIRYILDKQAAPLVAPGLTPTYAINLSRLTAAVEDVIRAAQAPPPRDAMSRSIADQIERGVEPRDD